MKKEWPDDVDVVTLTLNWFERVWGKQDRSVIFKAMREDCQVGGLPLGDRSPQEAFADFHDAILSAFDEFSIEPTIWVNDHETVVGQGRAQGKHRATGENVDFRYAFRATWQEGRMASADNIIEWHIPLAQVGLLKASELEALLAPPADFA